MKPVECSWFPLPAAEVTKADVENILNWEQTSTTGTCEVPFKPARVILQDFTGSHCAMGDEGSTPVIGSKYFSGCIVPSTRLSEAHFALSSVAKRCLGAHVVAHAAASPRWQACRRSRARAQPRVA